eukprot:SAG11_NODE_5173_length_1640_cov_2.052563_1_plen_26_part_01
MPQSWSRRLALGGGGRGRSAAGGSGR